MNLSGNSISGIGTSGLDVTGNVRFAGYASANYINVPTIGPSDTQQHIVPVVTSDTIILANTTQTLSNKTLINCSGISESIGILPVANGGSGVAVSTGSGFTTLNTSPVLTTPTITNPTITDGTLTTPTVTNGTLTNPTISGALVVNNSMSSSVITQNTSINTSGTTVTLINIPSWAKRVTILFNGVSPSSTDNFVLQLGTASGFATSGYTTIVTDKGGTQTVITTGFQLTRGNAAGTTTYGAVTLYNFSGNTWMESSSLQDVGGTNASYGSGIVTLSGVLTQIRLIMTGTNTYDAGSVNLLFE